MKEHAIRVEKFVFEGVQLKEPPCTKKILINSAGAEYFCITMGNHGFYNGEKNEHLEIEFLIRMSFWRKS